MPGAVRHLAGRHSFGGHLRLGLDEGEVGPLAAGDGVAVVGVAAALGQSDVVGVVRLLEADGRGGRREQVGGVIGRVFAADPASNF